jgi:hypothetical protein
VNQEFEVSIRVSHISEENAMVRAVRSPSFPRRASFYR